MPKFRQIILLSLILVTSSIFSGCTFSSSAKKTEIKLGENPVAQTQNESTTIADQDAKVNSVPAVDNNQNPEKSATDKATLPSTDTKTPPPVSAPKTADTSTEPAVPSNDKFKITDRLVSWGFTKSSGRSIDTIIIHSSYNAVGSDPHSLDDIINKEYKPAGVSPHYIISREGGVNRLVADQNIAYHAGVAKTPDSRTNVNDFSLGIEIEETKSEGPSAAQYASLRSLLSYLKGQYKIKYVLGHSDVAPGRKDDPWNFDWGNIK